MRITAAPLLLCLALACDRAPKHAPANHEMIGLIDRPAAGSTVGPTFLVSGWVAGREGVERVRLYLDDEAVGNAKVDIPRPDVDREFPRYAGAGLKGFAVTIDAGTRAGFRTLRIEAIDKSGAKALVASANVKIEP